ncbi:hypothetical protein SB861_30235 [Paraburkholderia sp. SIMBA_049]
MKHEGITRMPAKEQTAEASNKTSQPPHIADNPKKSVRIASDTNAQVLLLLRERRPTPGK